MEDACSEDFWVCYMSPLTATRIAVGIGQALAIGLFFLGLLSMNLFMILIALFVYMGAEAEETAVGHHAPTQRRDG